MKKTYDIVSLVGVLCLIITLILGSMNYLDARVVDIIFGIALIVIGISYLIKKNVETSIMTKDILYSGLLFLIAAWYLFF